MLERMKKRDASLLGELRLEEVAYEPISFRIASAESHYSPQWSPAGLRPNGVGRTARSS